MSEEIFERYYQANFAHWQFIPFTNHPTVWIPLAVIIALTTFGWLITDIICISLFFAARQCLCNLANKIKFECFSSEENGSLAPKSKLWEDVRNDYVKITDLCDTIQRYTSPLIVTCYLGVMSEIIVDLFHWIGPPAEGEEEEGPVVKLVFDGFPFLHYCLRVGAITYFAAELYEKSLAVLKWIHLVPTEAYSQSVEMKKNFTMIIIG